MVTIITAYTDFYIALKGVLHAFDVMVKRAIEFFTSVRVEFFIALTSIQQAEDRYDFFSIAVDDAEFERVAVCRVDDIDGHIP